MKKSFLASIAAAAALMAAADDSCMMFEMADGTRHSIASAGLEIVYADGQMRASNGTTTLTLPLASLKSMQFAVMAAADVTTADDCAVTLYTVDGVEAGRYASFADAFRSLPAGIYVAVKANGETLKLMIRK